MPYTGAAVIASAPPLHRPIPMRIAVPDGPDAKHRICTFAAVMARYYARGDVAPKCLWCEEEITGGVLTFGGGIGEATPGTYCSAACWLAAS